MRSLNARLAESVSRALDDAPRVTWRSATPTDLRGHADAYHAARQLYAYPIRPTTLGAPRMTTATPDTATDYAAELERWWNNAERGTPRKGDTYIYPAVGNGYLVKVASRDLDPDLIERRILKRARQPWQDAPAVMAHTADNAERRAFIYHQPSAKWWDSSDSDEYTTAHLIDPVPMIEARVTDAMTAAATTAYRLNVGLVPTSALPRRIAAAVIEQAATPTA